MDLRQLRYFLAVADREHMTRAAESLYVSQPALSQQISALERELGMPLFDRIGRGMELTAAGRVLRDHAVQILREVENARAAIDDLRGTVRGELTVATIQTANVSLLVDAIARFHAVYPGVVIRVREERAAMVADAVRNGEASLGITYVSPDAPENLDVIPLYEEELILVVPASHALAGTTLRTRDVAMFPLVVPPGGYCLRAGIDEILAEAGSRQTVVAEINAIEGICEAVRGGVGLAILPLRYIAPRALTMGLAIVRLVEPVPCRGIGVVRSPDRHVCTATRAFRDALVRTAADSALLASGDYRLTG